MNPTPQTNSTAPRGGRKPAVQPPDFVLRDLDFAVTPDHVLTDVTHEGGKILFTFFAEGEEVVLSHKPVKGDFPLLLDAVKKGSLGVGRHDVAFRGAVREHFHSAVIACHYRSLDKA